MLIEYVSRQKGYRSIQDIGGEWQCWKLLQLLFSLFAYLLTYQNNYLIYNLYNFHQIQSLNLRKTLNSAHKNIIMKFQWAKRLENQFIMVERISDLFMDFPFTIIFACIFFCSLIFFLLSPFLPGRVLTKKGNNTNYLCTYISSTKWNKKPRKTSGSFFLRGLPGFCGLRRGNGKKN